MKLLNLRDKMTDRMDPLNREQIENTELCSVQSIIVKQQIQRMKLKYNAEKLNLTLLFVY